MAYFVAKPGGRWEIRESRRTEKGPRAHTLASFSDLTPEVIEKAVDRSLKPIGEAELRQKAERAGIPVGASESDRLARALLCRLARGDRPRQSALEALVAQAGFDDERAEPGRPSGSPERRLADETAGKHLEDVVALAEALPFSPKREPGYPSLAERAAERTGKRVAPPAQRTAQRVAPRAKRAA